MVLSSWYLPERLKCSPANFASSHSINLANNPIEREATSHSLQAIPSEPKFSSDERAAQSHGWLVHGNQVTLVICKISGSCILL